MYVNMKTFFDGTETKPNWLHAVEEIQIKNKTILLLTKKTNFLVFVKFWLRKGILFLGI